jgi:hypothetical protein
MYCVKCKSHTETKDLQNVVSINGRHMLRGLCNVCRKTKTQFVIGTAVKGGDLVTGGDFVNSLNSVTSSIKLPWTKYAGEMHLPGHSFTGPGTRLDLRMNPDGTPKP